MSKIAKLFGFGSPKPAPLPPLPKREDPAIEEARKKQQIIERARVGRRGSVKTSGSGLEEDEDKIRRPGARSAKLLGE